MRYWRKYKKKAEDCLRSKKDPAYHIKAYNLLEPEDQENLKYAVALIGPISVSIKVSRNFFFYKSGIFYDSLCQDDGEQPNHAVLLVGYGTDPVLGEYWKIQNNWGIAWGEEGYARMARNAIINCGIASAAFYPEILAIGSWRNLLYHSLTRSFNQLLFLFFSITTIILYFFLTKVNFILFAWNFIQPLF